MNRYLVIIIGLLLFGCSSSTTKVSSEDQSWLDEQLKGVSNDDFKPAKRVRYNDNLDYHNIGDLVEDALSDESLQKISHGNLDPKDPISKIVLLCYQGKFQESAELSSKYYDKYKSNPSYWNQVGTCYYLQRNLKKAKIFYRRASTLDKKFIPSINNLGVVYLLESKDRKAQAAFEQALIVNKSSKTPKYNLANLYIRYGLVAKARQYLLSLNRSVSIRDKDIYLSLAYTELFENDSSGALEYLSKIDSEVLKTKKGALALYYAFKLSKSDKIKSLDEFLSSTDLNSQERAVYEKIKNL